VQVIEDEDDDFMAQGIPSMLIDGEGRSRYVPERVIS